MQTFDKKVPNDTYRKNPPFYRVDQLYKTGKTTSFLYLNYNYFVDSKRFLSTPPQKIERDFCPDNDGCVTYEYARGNVSPLIMNCFQRTYSLKGDYADVYRLGYLVGFDYEKMLEYVTSNDPEIFANSYRIIEHDRYLLYLIKSRLVAEQMLKPNDAEYFAGTITKYFNDFCKRPLGSMHLAMNKHLIDAEYIKLQAISETLPNVYHKLLEELRTDYDKALGEKFVPGKTLPERRFINVSILTCPEIIRR